MAFPDHIYKAYDIRGLYPGDLNEDLAYRTARWFADMRSKELNKTEGLTLVVGRDMRLSSPMMADAVIRGFTEQGANVVDIGLVSTPVFYYSVAAGGYDGGIVVSASHNPAEYSGLKLVRERSIPVSGDSGIMNLRDLVKSGQLPDAFGKEGSVEVLDGATARAAQDCFDFLGQVEYPKLNVVIDPANAMGAQDMDALFAGLNCAVERMFWELDGTFPNHEADPFKPENLRALQEKVKGSRADLGIAIDGDADRIFFVTETGSIMSPIAVRSLMADIMLRKHPQSTIVYDVRPGRMTKDVIEAAGGEAVLVRVGHSFFKEKILKTGAVFGGENSGHFFFQFPHGVYDSIMTTTLLVLAEMERTGKTLSELESGYLKYAHSGEQNFIVESVPEALEKIKDHFADRGEFNDLDGVSYDLGTVWFNVRGSNTEPKLRVNVEGNEEADVQKIVEEIAQLLS